MRRRYAGSAAIAAASFAAMASTTLATTLYSTSFETSGTTYAVGANLSTSPNGWLRFGTGNATVANTAGLARSGTNYTALTPGTATGGTFYEHDSVWSGANLAANPKVSFGSSLRIASPAAGTANRGMELGIQGYDANVNLLADAIVIWDPTNTLVGGGANHFYVFFDWFTGAGDTVGDGFGYDFGAVTSAQLSTLTPTGSTAPAGWFDFKITLDYSTGDVQFEDSFNGVETEHGSFAFGTQANAYTDFNDADYFLARGSTGGTLPRGLGDDYFVNANPGGVTPEPASLGLLTLAAAGLIKRRKH